MKLVNDFFSSLSKDLFPEAHLLNRALRSKFSEMTAPPYNLSTQIQAAAALTKADMAGADKTALTRVLAENEILMSDMQSLTSAYQTDLTRLSARAALSYASSILRAHRRAV